MPPERDDGAPSQDGEQPELLIGESNLVGQPLSVIERWAIEETLKLTGDNREEAAKVLGIGARTLYRRLDQYKKGEEGGDAPSDPEETSE